MSLELIPIGKTNKTHGVDGALRITVADAFWDDFVAAEVVFLESDGQPAPFFVEDRWGGDPLYLKLEDVDSREAARPLTNKTLFLRREDLSSAAADEQGETGADSSYLRWIGYEIVDEAQGRIGVIGEILEMPEQWLAALEYEGREVLIPLHRELIVGVDHGKKRVRMKLPAGLLDL